MYQNSTGKFSFQVRENEMLDLTQPLPARPPVENPLVNDGVMDEVTLIMHFANSLNNESQKYPKDRELRMNKLFAKYEMLYMMAPGTFMSALMGELYEGEVGKIVHAFIKADGDPTMIADNFEAYLDSTMEGINKAVEEYKKVQTKTEQ